MDIDAVRNATDADIAARFHPDAADAIARLPTGRQVFRGLPFDLGGAAPRPRWVVADGSTTIDLGATAGVSHVVVAHACDTWRDDDGQRPPGLAVGHVVPVGEVLVRYTVMDSAGRGHRSEVRRRFEVNDAVLGWGSAAFIAVPHLDNEVLDWRGPHPAQTPGRYAPAGQSGIRTILPGTYGGNLVGMTDFVPSATDDALLWLHAIAVDPAVPVASLIVEPLTNRRPGSDLLIAAVTLFRGTSDPLARSPRFRARVRRRSSRDEVGVDLGTLIRVRPAERPDPLRDDRGTSTEGTARADAADGENAHARHDDAIVGWGIGPSGGEGARPGDDSALVLDVDLSVAPDAVITIGDTEISARDLLADSGEADGRPEPTAPVRPSIVVLPAPAIRVDVDVVDAADGSALPARVRFVAADGRYLPPTGHRDEINRAFFEDTGGDLVLGSAAYAYVPGRFTIDLPPGPVDVEVVAGFDRRPLVRRLDIDASTRRIRLPLDLAIDRPDSRWVTADSHVHFLAPSTALLQAAAEDVDVVNLLAAGWGDLYTNVTDLPWGSGADPSGRRIVVVGTENRQNVLGHLALLGAREMTAPLTSGGPPEGRMAGALDVLLADWADRCRAMGGLAVAAHFPLPYAEIAADIVSGRIEAVETQALSPALDDPAVIEWYRFLNLGYRLPVVAGTDKMSAEVPIGAVRAYTHLLDDGPVTFDRWAAAVRAGRTFVTSGPILELAVEGREPGDVIQLDGPGHIEVRVRARAAQPVIAEVELVVNGRVVAATRSDVPAAELALHERLAIESSAWIAARSRSPFEIKSAFTSSMAAHTSPVYVEVRDRPVVPAAADVSVVEQVIAGTRAWIAERAAVADPAERDRMLQVLDASRATFDRHVSERRDRH